METIQICPSCGRPLQPNAPKGLCPECLLKAGFPTETQPAAGDPAQPKPPPFVPPSPEELGRLFPQLEVQELLGRGGMGAVYKARQPSLDRLVALKILPPGVAGDAGFAERFTREARALARLNHPNIVAVYDFGQAAGMPFFVMEYVDGPNLRELEHSGKLSPREAMQIIPQICEALQFAHDEGIVHRDIKPENILLDKKGRVKIADFGIAKLVGQTAVPDAGLTGAGDVVGTLNYMAPEQREKPLTVDHRADIFSLGVVFYELLTGELPIGKFAPPSTKAQVDVRLDEVVVRALEKEPERRYQHVRELGTDVQNITTGRSAAPPVLSSPPAHVGPPASPPEEISDCRILPAFLLGFIFGVFGAHRFYVGKIGTAVLQLFTFGGLGIWCTIDWILILCKAFKDKKGRRITLWV
jgi:serine/threonine protein kinase